MFQFPYMGTKHALAPIVADAAQSSRAGPFLDVFAGMCSVANKIQAERDVWTNDLQCFAVTAARSMLCDPEPEGLDLDLVERRFREHFDKLSTRFRPALREERLSLASRSFADFTTRFFCLETALDKQPNRQFDLFSTLYANTYVGLEQAIEIDALIYALDFVAPSRSAHQAFRRQFLFALGRTLLRVSTTTGHFAQYQTPSEKNWKRFQRTRRISVMDTFRADYRSSFSRDVRTPQNNRAFNMDAIALLRSMRRIKCGPAVVYADPPYKQDQYSRYYHLLETLIHYDYPRVSGKARYRDGRPSSVFSSKAKSFRGIEALASITASLGSDLILSYPEDGIASINREEMVQALAANFAKVEIIHEGLLRHSTMGASKGAAKQPVIERIYLGQN